MAFWDGMKRQLRSVIEWENASQDNLFEVWSENGDEIKNASKLLIKPGQGAVFVYEGKVEAVHLQEGLYTLGTDNIPFLTTLMKFMQAFESEHKVGIYFFWQTRFLNQKWGTATPIKYDDPVYNFPVSLRAHGNFSFKITKPEYFFVNVVGGRESYAVAEAKQVITDRLIQPLSDLFAEAGYSYAEIDKNREELSFALATKIAPDFENLGFEMTDYRIEGTDFDEETRERINKISDVQADAIAAQRAGIDYTQLQQLNALRDAAKNEGGAAGAGVGIGAGIGLGGVMAQGMMGGQPQASPQAAAPQAAEDPADPTVRLKKLKGLLDGGLISQEEFDSKKADILASI
jgi:membrane protease subunit (stomatin/prohibitin family)